MPRISLYQKNKDNFGFNDWVAQTLLLEKPIPKIMSTFSCTYVTATNFLKEVKSCKSISLSENSQLLANNFIRRVEERIKNNSNFSTLLILKADLTKYSIEVLKLLFKYYSEKDSNTNIKSDLILSIAYGIQFRYYERVYKREPNIKIFNKTQEMIKVCTC